VAGGELQFAMIWRRNQDERERAHKEEDNCPYYISRAHCWSPSKWFLIQSLNEPLHSTCSLICVAPFAAALVGVLYRFQEFFSDFQHARFGTFQKI
jgi:hypothetical protein